MSNKENDQFTDPESDNRSLLNEADAEERLSPTPPARDSMSLSVGNTEAGHNTEKHTGIDVFRDAELDHQKDSTGAPPSNTAPANCINASQEPVQVLRSGIDSLYLSYPGDLYEERSIELKTLKELARSDFESDQAEAIYELPGHQFHVNDKGSGFYSYILTDNSYRISLSSVEAERFPLAYVQIKSDWLAHRGVDGACAELYDLVDHFGEATTANVSRADLFVDFTCSFPFDQLPIAAWVSRARRISTHTIGRSFTGYSIGLGGDISARLYDKTLEIKESKKDYLKSIWSKKGWDGSSTVWRLEFQFKRRILTEHHIGGVRSLLDYSGPLWRYSTTEWLKLTVPSDTDTTQSRWPMHPVWAALSGIPWDESAQEFPDSVRSYNPPSDRSLFINGISGITSYMGREGITNAEEAFERFYKGVRHFHDVESDYNGKSFNQYLIEKAAAKARRYNMPYPGISEKAKSRTTEAKAKAKAAKAKAYRKARDGE